jgi:hypothetical protein
MRCCDTKAGTYCESRRVDVAWSPDFFRRSRQRTKSSEAETVTQETREKRATLETACTISAGLRRASNSGAHDDAFVLEVRREC